MEKYSYHDVKQRGTIERITYMVRGIEKYANVYVPYQYDSAKKYNVFYLVHGGGGNADAWLDCTYMKNMLDTMIHEGMIEPLLMVFPSFYTEAQREVGVLDREFESDQTLKFQDELRENLIPAVEGHYHTYAEGVTDAAIEASRDHRALSGFSMGGCVTWYGFTHNLDIIKWFVPLSGDCWELEVTGGKTRPKETALFLKETVENFGFTPEDFFLYPITGTEDIAYPNLTPQVEAMREYPDMFIEGQNFHYEVADGEPHSYEAVINYVYHVLPKLFK